MRSSLSRAASVGAIALTLFSSATALANEAAPSAAEKLSLPSHSAGDLFQILFGLMIVLAVMGGIAWMLRKAGVAGRNNGSVVKIVGGVNVGNRERVMVVEVADQWIVVGVAVGRVNALATLPKQAEQVPAQAATESDANNFASWLKQTIDKRKANQSTLHNP